jgi:hypothetical protein
LQRKARFLARERQKGADIFLDLLTAGETRGDRRLAVAIELGEDGRDAYARFGLIPGAFGDCLEQFVRGNVEPGSTIITAGRRGRPFAVPEGYRHETLPGEDGEGGDEGPPHVRGAVSQLRSWLAGTYQDMASARHLQAYLDEYAFRFNRRLVTRPGLSFYRLLEYFLRVPAGNSQ